MTELPRRANFILARLNNRAGAFMPDLTNTVASEFADHFENIAAKLHKWVEPLSNDQFWTNPYTYGNSVRPLVLHLTGTLSYFIGAQIAASGYLRNRDREFTETSRPP